MNVQGSVIGQKFIYDNRLKGYFDFQTNVKLSDDDLIAFHMATTYLTDHPEMFKMRTTPVSIIFVKDGALTLDFKENDLGNRMNLIIINHDKFTLLSQIKKIVIIVEEFVHHFWDESDEILVSKIVCECVPGVDYSRENGNYIFS